jgi:hypothetical protein
MKSKKSRKKSIQTRKSGKGGRAMMSPRSASLHLPPLPIFSLLLLLLLLILLHPAMTTVLGLHGR